MPQPKLIISLCALVLALGVALLKPLPVRASAGDAVSTTPDPTPTNADPILPPLPVVTAPPAVRRPAAVLHRAIRVPLGEKVAKYAKHFLGVRYVYGGS